MGQVCCGLREKGCQDVENGLGDPDIDWEQKLNCLDLRLEQRPLVSSHSSECNSDYENQSLQCGRSMDGARG